MIGGCLCGAIRYRLAATPVDAGWCHCRTCQLNSGSPAMAYANIPIADYVIEQGEEHLRSYVSSEHAERCFCDTCGTPLLCRDRNGPTTSINLATLDEPDAVRPGHHIYYDSRIAWAEAADDLERFAKGRGK